MHDIVLPKTGRLQRGVEERDRKGAKQELSLHSARTMPHHADVSWSTQHPGDNFTELIFPKLKKKKGNSTERMRQITNTNQSLSLFSFSLYDNYDN